LQGNSRYKETNVNHDKRKAYDAQSEKTQRGVKEAGAADKGRGKNMYMRLFQQKGKRNKQPKKTEKERERGGEERAEEGPPSELPRQLGGAINTPPSRPSDGQEAGRA
jgi:hypothetical protein